MSEAAKWYVIHTYSGYENKVAQNIEKVVENRKLHDLIQEVRVPTETVTEITDGKSKQAEHKTYPGYVLIKMIVTDDSWYVVRNTRGVTSFVGPGSKPVPLSDEEVIAMGIEDSSFDMNFELGEGVRVASGPFTDSTGIIKEINEGKRTVVVMISIFGRETPVELDYTQVEKIV